MEKKQIPIIALAIFSMSILFAQSFYVNPAYSHTVTTTHYDVTTDNTGRNLSGNTSHVRFDGEEITGTSALVGDEFNFVTIRMVRFGSPTGTAYLGVWDSTVAPTSSNYLRLISTIDVATISTSATDYTFELSSSYTFSANEMIGVFYNVDNGGGSSISLRFTTSSAFDSTNTRETVCGNPTSGNGCMEDITANDIRMTIFLQEGADTACIDTNLDGVTDLCFTDTNSDGIPDNGLGGSLGAFNSNANVTQMGQQWFCAFNIGDSCTNTNAETNGVGVFYLGIMIIFSYAILVSIHIMAIRASGKNVGGTQALMIHPILLLVMLFVDVAFAWYLNFIEDTIFYSVLVLMVGLGGFGVYRMVTKDN